MKPTSLPSSYLQHEPRQNSSPARPRSSFHLPSPALPPEQPSPLRRVVSIQNVGQLRHFSDLFQQNIGEPTRSTPRTSEWLLREYMKTVSENTAREQTVPMLTPHSDPQSTIARWHESLCRAQNSHHAFLQFLAEWSKKPQNLAYLTASLQRVAEDALEVKLSATAELKKGAATAEKFAQWRSQCSALNEAMVEIRHEAMRRLLETLDEYSTEELKALGGCDSIFRGAGGAPVLVRSFSGALNSVLLNREVDGLLETFLAKAEACTPEGSGASATECLQSNLLSLAWEFSAQLRHLSALYAAEGVQRLCVDFKRFPTVGTVGSAFFDQKLLPIVLRHLHGAREVILRNVEITPAAWIALGLDDRTRSLELDHCNYQSLQGIASMSKLKRLSLKHCVDGARLKALQPSNGRFPSSLRRLTLRRRKTLEATAAGQLEPLRQIPLRRLELEGFQGFTLMDLQDVPRGLDSLKLNRCSFASPDVAKGLHGLKLSQLCLERMSLDLDTFLEALSLEALRGLRLRQVSALEGNWLATLAKRASRLDLLDLGNSPLTVQHWKACIAGLSTELLGHLPFPNLAFLRMGATDILALGAISLIAPRLKILVMNNGDLPTSALPSLARHFDQMRLLALGRDSTCFKEMGVPVEVGALRLSELANIDICVKSPFDQLFD